MFDHMWPLRTAKCGWTTEKKKTKLFPFCSKSISPVGGHMPYKNQIQSPRLSKQLQSLLPISLSRSLCFSLSLNHFHSLCSSSVFCVVLILSLCLCSTLQLLSWAGRSGLSPLLVCMCVFVCVFMRAPELAECAWESEKVCKWQNSQRVGS